jgi:hypothetical protein
MYYVKVRNQTLAHGHIGSPIDQQLLDRVGVTITLDGDELERVIRWGYPNHGCVIQTYVGDAALQIIANW